MSVEYAFLGGIFPDELKREIKEKSKGNIQYASNALQCNIIQGLDINLGHPIKLINRMFVGSFPKKYKDFYIKEKVFSHAEGACDINMGFINIVFLRQLLIAKVTNKYLSDWIDENKSTQKVLIVYSANFMDAIRFVKKKDASVHICLILPDLPIFMNMDRNNSLLYKYINKRNQRNLLKSKKYVDSYVLLTEQMSKVMSIDDDRFIVVEGMVKNEPIVSIDSSNNGDVKTICYTGTLTKKYGIMDLIEGFSLLKGEEYRLVICGSGEAEAEIREACQRDKRIDFRGIVTREEALTVQRNATILVNPRKNNEEYTKYSFPSKTMEYMLAARPIVCYKLDGITREYDTYLNYVQGNSAEALKEALLQILLLDEEVLNRQGEQNRKFVLDKKNNVVQSKKILDLINKIV